MTRYRVAPYGVDQWKIQKRWLGLLWVDIFWLVAYDTYDRLSFSDKENATKWIDGTLELRETTWRRKLDVKARAKAPEAIDDA